MKESEYRKLVNSITTKPLSFPSLSIQKELDANNFLYIGWAIWCLQGLPQPQTPEEKKSWNMVSEYLHRNLKIVPDKEENPLLTTGGSHFSPKNKEDLK